MTTARFHSPPVRLLAIACLCAAVLFGVAGPAQAATLLPGKSIGNDSAPANTTLLGAVLPGGDTGYVGYSLKDAFGVTIGTGLVREIVISDPSNGLGGLDFLYQFKVATGTVGSVTMTNFTGFKKPTPSVAVDATVQNIFGPSAFGLPGSTAHVSSAFPIAWSGDGSNR